MIRIVRLFGKEIVRIGMDKDSRLGRKFNAITFFEEYMLYSAKNEDGEAWIGFSWGSGYSCKGIQYAPTIKFF